MGGFCVPLQGHVQTHNEPLGPLQGLLQRRRWMFVALLFFPVHVWAGRVEISGMLGDQIAMVATGSPGFGIFLFFHWPETYAVFLSGVCL